MSTYILGISAYYHDSAAALIKDDVIIAAAQEERFTRKKHDSSFPLHAVKYVMTEGGISIEQLEAVAFYDKPFIKFERLLETYHAFVPKGLFSFWMAIPVWIKEKLFLQRIIKKELKAFGFTSKIPILYPEHHLSHAASAFYPSPFEDAAILTVDGVGEWATSTICHGTGSNIKILKELRFPHSIGLLYSAFTYFTGFRVNSGEYKLMGLAPYGNRNSERVKTYYEIIKDKLVDIREDGSILLNMKYFHYATGLRMTSDRKWQKLFSVKRRTEEGKILQEHMDLALAAQMVTEEIVMKLAQTAQQLTGSKKLVMAGGVALNSVANGRILKEKWFEDMWIQPAAGDAGGALGAALAAYYIYIGKERKILPADSMQGSYLGPSYTDTQIEGMLHKYQAKAEYIDDDKKLTGFAAGKLVESKVVGWFQGRMEYGPRALGNRSILGNPCDKEMQKKLNLKIKYREGFRPFAPSVLEEDIQTYFDIDRPSPYMLLVIPVNEKMRKKLPGNFDQLELYDRLYTERSELPAITHLDFSARIQSVSKAQNPLYWQLINDFKKKTGYGVIINTSFNVRGEPIVCTPEEAYLCFMRTEMDYLVIGNYVFDKTHQNTKLAEKLKKQKMALD